MMRCITLLFCVLVGMTAGAGERFEFTRLIAHWASYSDPGYLSFVDEAKPEVVQVGFYGAHFWSLADTAAGSGYPAHLPVRGHKECGEWFERLNGELHQRGVKVVGHMNVKFLVGDPDGPRGFFRFYRDQWDEQLLGPKPVADPIDLLEKDKAGEPISNKSYGIGGMREYWACLNNPHWRQVLKAWVRCGINRGVDGFIANYFYRHDCHCEHCVKGFKQYLGARFKAKELRARFGIANLATHQFDEIVCWHDPAKSTPLRREMLRFSQIANKAAFDEVFVKFGRSLKPDLIVAQWNHLGDFGQISGDERCFLPDDLWGKNEDYLWYSTGGTVGDATLQARYIRGAFDDKPFTLGKYESVRIRGAIAELAANGGAPMGFYTDFRDSEARREIVRYYNFLRQHKNLYRANRPHAEVALLFPRTRVHAGDVSSVSSFKDIGKRLLDDHVLFDVLPDDHAIPTRYAAVISNALQELSSDLSRFDAPKTVRVSASRPEKGNELTLHFVNSNRDEPTNRASGIKDEKPIATPPFQADVKLLQGHQVARVEFLTPEVDQPKSIEFEHAADRLRFRVPGFLVYGVARIQFEEPFGIDRRIPWDASRVAGSPDPPLPYTVEKAFTNITWKKPMYVAPEPGSDRLLVVQEGGQPERPSKIFRVRDDPSAERAETFLVISNRVVYSVAFHPGYQTNGFLYVFSNGPTPKSDRTNRISRFTVNREPPHDCDPASERSIIEWRSAGHDGGGMVFGHDGMFYISTGDGTSDSDTWITGQGLNELLGGILRIDVDHTDGTNNYRVPKDNPFLGMTNARPENWAYGLRNPWRLCVDAKTGQIWTGNNGQDLWETAHLIRRGENYGWSVYEGSHPFYLNRKLGPTPAVPPTLEHPHSEARSLTGGIVYYGDELSELNGVYVYGDYSTGKIWGARHDGRRVTWHKELANTQLQIAAFAVSHRGELLIVDHAGAIYRFMRPPKQKSPHRFPTRLSETGLFVSTKDHQPHPALIPYSVNAPGWADGASVERFMALPDGSRIGRFTNGAVLVQTLSLEQRRIETRLLINQHGQWAGYSYRWNERHTDASLVDAKGEEKTFGGQTWRFPSRVECMTCHSRAAEFVLGINDMQLNKVHNYDALQDNQLRTLKHIGVFTGTLPKSGTNALVDPYDATQTLEARARSYLHVNCSVCHVDAGGGNSKMDLRFTVKPERMELFSARPQHDTFGIDNAMLIFPGDADRSILYQRLSRRGRGQMPPLVTSVVDERAVALFKDWISEMKLEQAFVRDWKPNDLLPLLPQLKEGRSIENGRTAFKQTGCIQCHRFAGEGGSVGPDLTGIARRLSTRDLLESILLPSKTIADGYATTEIETKSGEIISGRVEREDDRVLIMRPPTATEEMLTIRKSDIRRRALSQTSNMPTGMLNTLNESQVLDLLSYLISDDELSSASSKP